MLNISRNSIANRFPQKGYSALKLAEGKLSGKVLRRVIIISLLVLLVIMFLPWTQNIRSHGKVTTLKPEHRPQTIHTIIPGRIEKWYVQEGDFVEKGDTLVYLSEVKDAYFDDDLLERTKNQRDLKEKSVGAYQQKIEALNRQIKALTEQQQLKLQQTKIKLQQAELKLVQDKGALEAAEGNLEVAKAQYKRFEELYEQDLKSLTDLENRRVKLQDATNYEIQARNKWLASQSEVINAKVEISNINSEYDSKIAKVNSDLSTAESNMFDAESGVNKLNNQYSNYLYRNGLYYITAPQSGYIAQTMQTGLGQTIKEGEAIIEIMPTNYQLAVELYVEPLDLPLISKGQHVRIQFDGWPAIVFSGWPNVSYGTYGGKVYAIDQHISPNGKYRVLVEPEEDDHPWPEALRYGSGTNTMILLDDVPVWYEMWRQINGFPPDFYQHDKEKNQKDQKK